MNRETRCGSKASDEAFEETGEHPAHCPHCEHEAEEAVLAIRNYVHDALDAGESGVSFIEIAEVFATRYPWLDMPLVTEIMHRLWEPWRFEASEDEP